MRSQKDFLKNTNKSLEDLYTAEILHLISLQWSSIKIYFENFLMATSHLIGSNHLPSVTQLSINNAPYLVKSLIEKAMLIRNVNGDYAIVKGKWVNLRKGVAGTSYSNRGIQGNPGNLQVEIHFLKEKSIKRYEINDKFI